MVQPVTIHDLRGSGHLVAMARSILSLDIQRVGPEDDPNGPRQLRVLKKNRGKYPQPLAVQYHAAPDNPDVAVLEYGPLAQFFANPPESLTAQCAEWLVDQLREMGPLAFQTVIDLAAEAGFKRGVVIKARLSLGKRIVDTKGARVAGNRWTLADEGEAEEVELIKLVDQCSVWLLDVLAAKPLSYQELVELGAEAGFTVNSNAKHQKPTRNN